MKTNTIRALLKTPGLNGRKGIPVVYTGKPGVGKSSVISQVVESMGLHLEIVLASLREPADFLGLPVPNKDGSMSYTPPNWAKRVAEKGNAVVLFDEINTAPPAVQAALLRVLLEGVVGDLVLPPGVRFVAAMNSVADAAGGWDLAPPLANRLCHLGWTSPTVQEWSTHVSGGRQAITASAEDFDRKVWDREHAQAIGEIAGFLHSQQQYLHQQPDRSSPAASGAWPSPRSWEMTSRALAGSRIEGLSKIEQEEVTSGCIGVKASNDFHVWREKEDLPSADDLLSGKAKFTPKAKRPDRSAAILASCVALLNKRPLDKDPKEVKEYIPQYKTFAGIAADIGDQSIDLLHCIAMVFTGGSAYGLTSEDPNIKRIYQKMSSLVKL